MKALSYLMIICLLSIFACEGPEGPRGPQGPRGEDGLDGLDGQEGYTFEYTNVDFTSPEYSALLEFPSDFSMLESDVALVYFLWGTVDFDGEEVDEWRPLPMDWFTDSGQVQYNYNFTKYDVVLYMDGEVDLGTLGAQYTDGWVVRVVVVPAQFADNGRTAGVDLSNYKEVVEYFGLEDPPVDEKYRINRFE